MHCREAKARGGKVGGAQKLTPFIRMWFTEGILGKFFYTCTRDHVQVFIISKYQQVGSKRIDK